MDNKVQEITDKIYQEGVEKGQAEAQRIIEDAEKQRAEIIKKAQQESEKIIDHAKKSSEELSKNTRSELHLYAGRAVEALKSEIADLLTDSVISSTVKSAIDKEWLQKLMLSLATEWITREKIVIQTSDADSLKKYFASKAKQLLDKGLTIEQVNNKTASFAIMPADGSYKIQFGEEEFAGFFKDFLRPQLFEMLFKQ